MMGMALPLLVLVLVAVVVAWVVVTVNGQSRLSTAERAELERLRVLVDDLKELAWDHREIDPDLSTIVIDTIRTSERGGPGDHPGGRALP